MILRSILRPYRKRLLWLAVLKALPAALVGLHAGYALKTALGLIAPIYPTSYLLYPVVGVSVFTLVSLALDYPSIRRTALALDEHGLDERIQTMLAFSSKETPVLQAQRNDALDRLRYVKVSELKTSLPGRRLAALAVIMVLALSLKLLTGLIYFDPQDGVTDDIEISQEEKLIRELMQDMRIKITQSGLSHDEKEELLSLLAALEVGMGNGEAGLDEVAIISQAAMEIAEKVERVSIYSNWLEEFLQHDCLKALGEALIAEDHLRILEAFLNMENRLLTLKGLARQDALMEIHLALNAALEEGKPSDTDAAMAYAFSMLRSDLMEAAVLTLNKKDSEPRIREAIFNARGRVMVALGAGEKPAEDAAMHEAGSSPSAREDIIENRESFSEGEEGISQSLLHDGRKVYSDNPNGLRGAGTGIVTTQRHVDSERIFEPSLDTQSFLFAYVPGEKDARGNIQRVLAGEISEAEGSIPYGRVYGIYFAKLLEQIENDIIPADMLETVEKYFYGL